MKESTELRSQVEPDASPTSSVRGPKVATMNLLLVCVSVTCLLTVALAQSVAEKAFEPPRTAVVDIYKVFEGYEKKRAVEEEMRAKAANAKKEVLDLEGQLKEIETELQLVPEESDAYEGLILKRQKLVFALKKLQKKLRNEFRKRHQEEVTSIRDEISRELSRYGEAHELNLILEKTFFAELGDGVTLNWPIIHHVSADIDITDEMIEILNSRKKDLSQ